MPTELAKKIKRVDWKAVLFLLLIAVAILGTGGSYFYFKKYSALKANPNLEAQNKTKAIVVAVGKLMELPQGETPTIATISEKDKLAGQVFFKTAQNGDILLAYTTAMEAILYRPSTNKIINVAPINISQPSVVPETKPAAVSTTTSLPQ